MNTEKDTNLELVKSGDASKRVAQAMQLIAENDNLSDVEQSQVLEVLERYQIDLENNNTAGTLIMSAYTDIIDFLKVLLKYSWLIILVALLGGGLAYFVASNQTEIYETRTSIAILPNFAQDSIPRPIQEIEIALGTYIQVLRSGNLRQNVEIALSETYSEGELDDVDREITPVSNSAIIVVSIQSPDPVLAQTYAREITNQLTTRNPLPLFEVAYRPVVLDEPALPTSPALPDVENITILGAVGSLIVGVMLAFLLDTYLRYFRN